ncbi:MAG: hypothetical protein INF65_15180 [Roseomonas sp.]|nr:hypothetical protein [Roseomonas sp.]MCA3774692.1 hypothetical protein [Cutibacterium sp.]
MSDTNVVAFPRQASAVPSVTQSVAKDLFGFSEASKGKVAFEFIDNLNEELLLRIIVCNSVSTVVDLRPKSVFLRPKFQHKRIFEFFHRNRIEFFEYSLRALDGEDKIKHWFSETAKKSNHGLILCICDDSARGRGIIAKFKGNMRLISHDWSEVHPRAISGKL